MQSLREIGFVTILLLLSILFFAYAPIDLWIQDFLYDRATHHWLLDRNLQPYRLIFYDGIKKLLILFGLLLLFILLFGRRYPIIQRYQTGILIMVLSALIVPQTISILKKQTNMPCPKHIKHYEGLYPETKVWERYPTETKLATTQCWPAGHASGGFVLLSLYFLFKKPRNRKKAACLALGLGWIMGGYKMLIGDHFFSHTWITMLLSWLIILSIAKFVTLFQEDRSALP
jgi:membrane-associated PAP2 superfamily phosphatase